MLSQGSSEPGLSDPIYQQCKSGVWESAITSPHSSLLRASCIVGLFSITFAISPSWCHCYWTISLAFLP